MVVATIIVLGHPRRRPRPGARAQVAEARVEPPPVVVKHVARLTAITSQLARFAQNAPSP